MKKQPFFQPIFLKHAVIYKYILSFQFEAQWFVI